MYVKLDPHLLIMEVVILLPKYLVEYVFPTKEDINLSVFDLIIRTNESKTFKKHVNVNVNLTVKM